VQGLIAAFDEHLARAALAERSKVEYARTVRRFASWAEDRDDWPPTDPWQREHLTRDYKRFLQRERKQAPATINATLSALDVLWRASGLGPADVPHLPLPERAPRGLGAEDERRLLRAAERRGIRTHAMILTMCLCGPRLAEMCALDVDDVALTARTGMLYIRSGKGSRPREVPIPAQARPVLGQWLTERSQMRGANTCPALWLTLRGGRIATTTLDEVIRKTALATGTDRLPPVVASAHTLRHTAIHRMKREGIDVDMIRELAGHARLSTTQVYGRATAEEKGLRADALRVDY
jgi:site-specific recombinase XerD